MTDSIIGDLDKPFHRPECKCEQCEEWRQANRPADYGSTDEQREWLAEQVRLVAERVSERSIQPLPDIVAEELLDLEQRYAAALDEIDRLRHELDAGKHNANHIISVGISAFRGIVCQHVVLLKALDVQSEQRRTLLERSMGCVQACASHGADVGNLLDAIAQEIGEVDEP